MRPIIVKRCPHDSEFMVRIFDGIIRPSIGFDLKITALKDLVSIMAFFIVRRMKSDQALLE